MNCECGEPLLYNTNIGQFKTVVGFYSPEGHNHDDNCITRHYTCKNGHVKILGIINKCFICDWKGKAECFCCQKVEEWPDSEKE